MIGVKIVGKKNYVPTCKTILVFAKKGAKDSSAKDSGKWTTQLLNAPL